MDLRIDVHHHIEFDERRSPLTDVLAALGRIETALHSSFSRVIKMSADLDTKISTLKDDVANLTAVDASAVALIQGFAAQLQAAIDDAKANGVNADELTALDDLHASITAQSSALGAAVAANTPAAPTPEPTPADTGDNGGVVTPPVVDDGSGQPA